MQLKAVFSSILPISSGCISFCFFSLPPLSWMPIHIASWVEPSSPFRARGVMEAGGRASLTHGYARGEERRGKAPCASYGSFRSLRSSLFCVLHKGENKMCLIFFRPRSSSASLRKNRRWTMMQAARSSPYAKGYGKKGPPSIPEKKRKEKGGEAPLIFLSEDPRPSPLSRTQRRG